MTCITCTDKGRIFLAGRDGHIYEMHYTTGSGWNKRCRKVCLTVGLGSVISRYYLNLYCFLSYFKCLIYISADGFKILKSSKLHVWISISED